MNRIFGLSARMPVMAWRLLWYCLPRVRGRRWRTGGEDSADGVEQLEQVAW